MSKRTYPDKISHEDVMHYIRLRKTVTFFARSLGIVPPLGVVGEILSYPMEGTAAEQGYRYLDNLLIVTHMAHKVLEDLRMVGISYTIETRAIDAYNYVEVVKVYYNGKLRSTKQCSNHITALLHAIMWVGSTAIGNTQ